MSILSDQWSEYRLLDAGEGEKLEAWGGIVLRRPEPAAIWQRSLSMQSWQQAQAQYHRSSGGGGNWEAQNPLPEHWTLSYKKLTFKVRPTGFKHTGLFPEQAANWDFIQEHIQSANRPIRLLNLFAYTGGATMAAASAGAKEVVHVDAAKGMVTWARENASLCGLEKRPVRYLVDDVFKFVQREVNRGSFYDAIVLDPPSYGRGPNKEIWKIEIEINQLMAKIASILTPNPLFVILNSYTTGISATALENVFAQTLIRSHGGKATGETLCLPVEKSPLVLPCGSTIRWQP